MTKTRNLILALTVAVAGIGLTACSSDSDVASKNLSKDADNFKIQRRIVFYNGITDAYLLEVRGLCSVEGTQHLAVTCKVGKDKYIKHFLQTSDNVTWFAEQIQAADVSTDHYKVIFKPSTIIPDIELR